MIGIVRFIGAEERHDTQQLLHHYFWLQKGEREIDELMKWQGKHERLILMTWSDGLVMVW